MVDDKAVGSLKHKLDRLKMHVGLDLQLYSSHHLTNWVTSGQVRSISHFTSNGFWWRRMELGQIT